MPNKETDGRADSYIEPIRQKCGTAGHDKPKNEAELRGSEQRD